jgi:hypothetical protein
MITAGWHETKHALISVNSYINISSELMIEFVDSIGDLKWWLSNGLNMGINNTEKLEKFCLRQKEK